MEAKATGILVKEHDLILQMLKQLSIARDKLEQNEKLPQLFFEKTVLFSRNFADRFHHFKEEFLMFGLLADKKNGTLDAEIGALRYQHDRCRNCITEIERALDGYLRDDEIAATTLIENVSAYISMLRRHIYLEDRIFFPMVDKLMTDDEQKMLIEQFIIEEERIGAKEGFEPSRQLLSEITSMLV